MTDTVTTSQGVPRRLGMRGVLTFIAIVITAVPFALIIGLIGAKAAWLQRIDLRTEASLHQFGLHHPNFVRAMHDITNSGSTLVWLVTLTVVGLWLIYRRLSRLAAFVAVTAIGSSLLNEAVKVAVGRARPVLVNPFATATGKSFPSAHTQSAIVGYGILVLVLLPTIRGRWRAPVAAIAVLNCASHRAEPDRLGRSLPLRCHRALLIGSAWLFAMTAAFSVWRRDDPKTPMDVTVGEARH